ncbi:MAG: methyltransferase domain-containing protein [Verrucomicrobia bacterium]|nr:MAG: methyltransferase domain-containing protein [Verrucomicrobiota bacterium]
MTSENTRVCWCQCKTLRPFGGGYLHCARCESLVFEKLPDDDLAVINDEDGDLYGRNYYLQHLVKDFGYPDLDTRLRSDLPERCLHWLITLLKYKRPGAKILELGCGHGASVALFRAAGYDATGLELSPWLVAFAQEKWQIPVLQGPLEQQNIEPGSLDAIVAFDVFEHLIDPQKTANLCASLLKKDGILIIQTPEYPARTSFEELRKQNHPFLTQLKPVEHLHLFSNQAARKLMRNAGLTWFVNEPAIFAHYDQYFVASRKKPAVIEAKEMEESLRRTVPGRLVQAMIDLRAGAARNNDSQSLQCQLAEAQADRAERLRVISRQGEEITRLQQLVRETEEDRDRWQTRASEAREELGRVLAEFDARLKELAALYERATRVENDRKLARAQLADLQKHFEAAEADRAEWLKVIESQGTQIGELQASIASYLSELEETRDYAKQLEQKIGFLEGIVAATEKERDKWLARTQQAEPELEAKIAEVRALAQQLADSERALAAQRENSRQLEARVAALETDLAETRVQHAAASAASDTANRALSNLLAKVATLRRSRLYTALRKLGLVPRV